MQNLSAFIDNLGPDRNSDEIGIPPESLDAYQKSSQTESFQRKSTNQLTPIHETDPIEEEDGDSYCDLMKDLDSGCSNGNIEGTVSRGKFVLSM